jgi:hypothetical protein
MHHSNAVTGIQSQVCYPALNQSNILTNHSINKITDAGMWAKLRDDRGTWAQRIAHPFTIASPPKTSQNGESLVFFHIRVLNGFTKRLAILYCSSDKKALPKEDITVTNTNLNLCKMVKEPNHADLSKVSSQSPGVVNVVSDEDVILMNPIDNATGTFSGSRQRVGSVYSDFSPGNANVQRFAPLDDLVLYGPYGSPLTDAFGKSKVAVCIAGGIGVTPFFSLLWDALMRAQAYREYGVSQRRFRLRKIYFLWLSPQESTFRSFRNVIRDIEDLDIKLGTDLIEIKLVLSGAAANQDIRRMLNTAVRRTRRTRANTNDSIGSILSAAAAEEHQDSMLDFKKADYGE